MAKRGRRKRSVRLAASDGIDLMRYAAEGAKARLQELAREAGELFRHFPQLRTESSFPWVSAGGTRAHASAASPTVRRRRKRKMSAEARARISAAQKKRWAEQRNKSNKGQ